jgi:hypothetical protein
MDMLLGVMAFVGAVFYCLFGAFRAFVAGGLLCGAALFGWGYWQMEQAQNAAQQVRLEREHSRPDPTEEAARGRLKRFGLARLARFGPSAKD